MNARSWFRIAMAGVLVLGAAVSVSAQAVSSSARPAAQPNAAAQHNAPASNSAFDQVIDRIIAAEQQTITDLREYSPLIETYIQLQRPELNSRSLESDQYFLGKADLSSGAVLQSMTNEKKAGFWGRMFSFSRGLKFIPAGFLEMIYVDRTSFNRSTYNFTYLRREFLGEVRCLVFDIAPVEGAPVGRFRGRIWVEDQEFHIVRFNGVYEQNKRGERYFHFDSWRMNLAPGKWLPAYIYSEESEGKNTFWSGSRANFRSQTRLWGYNRSRVGREMEFSQILIEAENAVKDKSDAARDPSPVEAQRLWNRQAEENVLEKLEAVGLIAPRGEVDKVLETVINNLVVTNNLSIEPEVRARVQLTCTLEAYTIGNTIVMSRGLLDTLPDEASLAAIIAQQLGHILSGHQVEGKYAFNDRLIFPDDQALKKLNFRRSDEDLAAAGGKGMELMRNSPYKDQLEKAGLFIATLELRSQQLPNLIQPKLGNGVITASAPPATAGVQMDNKEQITALPLGSRLKVDPWSGRADLAKGKPVALVSAAEKMPFEVTPFALYLTRFRSGSEATAPEAVGDDKNGSGNAKPAAGSPVASHVKPPR